MAVAEDGQPGSVHEGAPRGATVSLSHLLSSPTLKHERAMRVHVVRLLVSKAFSAIRVAPDMWKKRALPDVLASCLFFCLLVNRWPALSGVRRTPGRLLHATATRRAAGNRAPDGSVACHTRVGGREVPLGSSLTGIHVRRVSLPGPSTPRTPPVPGVVIYDARVSTAFVLNC